MPPTSDKQRPKVLRIITRLNVGGPARQIDSLVEHLNQSKFDHIIVTGAVGDGEIEHPVTERADISLRRLPELGRSVNLFSDVKALVGLIRVIREERPDIVHTHLAKAGLLGRLAALLTRVPVRVHTFHGHLLSGYFDGWRLKSYVLLERFLGRITSFQICVGEQVRQDLSEAGIIDPSKSRAVYPGIRPPDFVPRSTARKQLDVEDESFVILFVGRLVEVKRLDRFIRVVNDLSFSCPRVVALVVGDGPARLEHQNAMQDPAQFRFEGWQHDLGPYFGAADVVCLTSDNEGMPIALIEGALCGIPAVTTAVGSAGEVVVDQCTGFVVPPKDTQQFVSRLLLLAEDKVLRDRLGNAAKEHAYATFGGERLARDHERIYESLIRQESE